MSTVFITQIPSRIEQRITGPVWAPIVDVSPAKLFGDLCIMLPSGMNYSDAALVVRQLREPLKTFDPDKDFLLAVGDPVVIAVASAMVGYDHEYFWLLKWDRQQRRYIPYEVKLHGQ